MIEDIELSPSNSAKCNSCSKIINKGVPRGYRINNKYGSKECYCYKCALIYIDDGIKMLKETKIRLKKMIKQNSKAIILEELK